MLSAELHVEPGGTQLRLRRTGGCHGCAAAGGCGSAALAAGAKPYTVPLPATGVAAAEHSVVRAEMKPGVLLSLCAVVFLPLSVALAGGAWLAAAVWPTAADAGALIGAIAGLAVGCGLLKRYDAHFGSRWLRHRRWILLSGRDAQGAS